MLSLSGSLQDILQVPKENLEKLEQAAREAGFQAVLDVVEKKNEELIQRTFKNLNIAPETGEEVRARLFEKIIQHENELYQLVGVSPERFHFEKVAQAAREITTKKEGFFLRKEYAREILQKRPPKATMRYLGYSDVEEMLRREDIGDVFSALRFTETDAWMHTTFDEAYRSFTPDHFEHREIEVRVLGPQWERIAQKYIAKKHHNVSHLKEFGIIFLNPIAQTEPGKFIRDFALLLHYFHEISFYSKLFERYRTFPNFSERVISLLRGDVLEPKETNPGEWLIVQRYLWKENPKDPRLFLPRVNPESLHWRKAQKDFVEFGKKSQESDLEFWDDLDAVGGLFDGELVSFDMEDNAMGVASQSDGKRQTFFYHQREALWNKIFAEYVGGYDILEHYIIENMEKGKIKLQRINTHQQTISNQK